MRIVIDTNLWISFLIGRKLSWLLDLLKKDDIRILTSVEQVMELDEVMRREKFRRYFSMEEAEEVVNILTSTAEFVEIDETVEACRDPDDDFLLAIAVCGHADTLLTGDNDLLVLHPFRGIDILQPGDLAPHFQ